MQRCHPRGRAISGGALISERESLGYPGATSHNEGFRAGFVQASSIVADFNFDLSIYDLLFPLLEQVPIGQRVGAIVKGEHGLPIRYRTFAKTFRKIARYAKIPDEVWNMDARAGGATEADDAGLNVELIGDGMTHTNKPTTLRYIRRRAKKVVTIAEARKLSRAASEGDDGGTA